jgi:hypothetical protein
MHRAITPDPRLLFRYSALTFNTHRIHYDVPYARDVERYRGPVVHAHGLPGAGDVDREVPGPSAYVGDEGPRHVQRRVDVVHLHDTLVRRDRTGAEVEQSRSALSDERRSEQHEEPARDPLLRREGAPEPQDGEEDAHGYQRGDQRQQVAQRRGTGGVTGRRGRP